MEIIGNLVSRKPAEQKTEKFRLQEFVVDCSFIDNYTQEKRENILLFQCSNNNITKLDAVKDGSRIKVLFMPQGRYYNKQDGTQAVAVNLNAFGFEVINEPKTITQNSDLL